MIAEVFLSQNETPCSHWERSVGLGKKDDVTSVYFRDDERYADLINVHIFSGLPVVTPEQVREKDTRVQGVIRKIKERFQFVKYRDIVRKVVFGTTFAVIGLEHQSGVDYAMPVRVMLEDAAGYQEQLLKIQKIHRRKGDLRGAEYVSGFTGTDRICPVITLVLYYGEEPWNGPKDLIQMMDGDEVPQEIRKFVNGYPIHIIDVRNYPYPERFQTDLREVFGFIQRSGDREKLRRYVEERKEQFEHLEEDAYDLMIQMTGSGELISLQDEWRDEGGKIDMCKALRDWAEEERKEGRREGREEGRKEGRKEGREEGHQDIARNMYRRHTPLEEIAEICEVSVEQVKIWAERWENR